MALTAVTLRLGAPVRHIDRTCATLRLVDRVRLRADNAFALSFNLDVGTARQARVSVVVPINTADGLFNLWAPTLPTASFFTNLIDRAVSVRLTELDTLNLTRVVHTSRLTARTTGGHTVRIKSTFDASGAVFPGHTSVRVAPIASFRDQAIRAAWRWATTVDRYRLAIGITDLVFCVTDCVIVDVVTDTPFVRGTITVFVQPVVADLRERITDGLTAPKTSDRGTHLMSDTLIVIGLSVATTDRLDDLRARVRSRPTDTLLIAITAGSSRREFAVLIVRTLRADDTSTRHLNWRRTLIYAPDTRTLIVSSADHLRGVSIVTHFNRGPRTALLRLTGARLTARPSGATRTAGCTCAASTTRCTGTTRATRCAGATRTTRCACATRATDCT